MVCQLLPLDRQQMVVRCYIEYGKVQVNTADNILDF